MSSISQTILLILLTFFGAGIWKISIAAHICADRLSKIEEHLGDQANLP